MQKYTKVFEGLQVVISLVFIFLFYRLGLNFGDELCIVYPALTGFQFILKYAFLIIIILFVYFISVIAHELGHLIFGLNAGLMFEEFNIFSISVAKKDGKLSIKKTPHLANIGGYCNLSFVENKSYIHKNLIFYLLGGIMANFLLTAIFGVCLIFANNIWLKYFFILMAATNAYFGINNALPTLSPMGIEVDMLKAINLIKDKDYLMKMDMIVKITEQQKHGVPLAKLPILNPDTFNSSADVIMSLLYVDRLIELEMYTDARKLIQRIKTEGKTHLSKQNEILLSLQLMDCELNDDCNIAVFKELWTKPVKKQTRLLSRIHPSYLLFMYAGAVLVENDNNAANKYLDEFAKMSTKLSEDEVITYKQHFEFINSKKTS